MNDHGLLIPPDLEDALRALGVTPARSDDAEVWARCPGHRARTGKDDRHPSWSINRQTGAHHCFSCGYAGSLTSLCSDLLGTTNVFRINEFLLDHGADLADALARLDQPREPEAEPERVAESHLAIFTDPPPWALEQRKLSADACAFHGVRWDPRADAWILPIRDLAGTLLGWQSKSARVFRNHPRGVKKGHTLFGAHVFRGTRAILVESPLDAVRLTTEGYDGALASYGVHVSNDQIRIILRLADTLVLALDNDNDGRRITAELIPRLEPRLQLYSLNYRQTRGFKDIGDMSSDQIRWALDNAQYTLFQAWERGPKTGRPPPWPRPRSRIR